MSSPAGSSAGRRRPSRGSSTPRRGRPSSVRASASSPERAIRASPARSGRQCRRRAEDHFTGSEVVGSRRSARLHRSAAGRGIWSRPGAGAQGRHMHRRILAEPQHPQGLAADSRGCDGRPPHHAERIPVEDLISCGGGRYRAGCQFSHRAADAVASRDWLHRIWRLARRGRSCAVQLRVRQWMRGPA